MYYIRTPFFYFFFGKSFLLRLTSKKVFLSTYFYTDSSYASATGTTLTVLRSLRPFLNSTVPSTKA